MVVVEKEKSIKEKNSWFLKKKGGRYEEKEIDFGKHKGLEVL